MDYARLQSLSVARDEAHDALCGNLGIVVVLGFDEDTGRLREDTFNPLPEKGDQA